MSWLSRLVSLLFLCIGTFSFGFDTTPTLGRVDLIPVEKNSERGQPILLRVQLSLTPSWHTYGEKPGDAGVAPVFTWELPKGLSVQKIMWPTPTLFERQGIRTFEYQGMVTWTVSLVADSEIKDGEYPIKLHLSWVACGDLCVPQESDAQTIVRIGPHPVLDEQMAATLLAPPVQEPGLMSGFAEQSLWHFILLGFAGGLILNIMPCVLPVIGLKVVSFISASKLSYRQSLISSFMYTFGVLVMFWALTIALFFLQRANSAFGWGFQLQNPYFVSFLILLFFVISANLFGLFEFGSKVAAWAQEKEEQVKQLGRNRTYLKSFAGGLLVTCVATPCTGPLLGVVIGFASFLTLTKALILFSSIALGMASPFVLIALLPPLAWLLPKPGPWMVTFKQLLGFLLLLCTIWLTWVLSRIAPGFVFEWLMMGALVLFLGAWLFGKSQQHSGFILSKLVFFLSLIAFTLGCFFTIASFKIPLRQGFHTFIWGRDLVWEDYSEKRLNKEIDAGHIVLVDGSARWCLTCQMNRLVFANESLKTYLLDNNIVLLEADWTNQDPEVSEWLHSVNRNGVPTLVLYVKGKPPYLLPELITPAILKDGIEDVQK